MNLVPRIESKLRVCARNHKTTDHAAFSLTELLVTLATLSLLVLIVFPTLGSAKVSSRQLSCLNNLRQLGVASHMYVLEYQQYTGSYSPVANAYVWQKRLLSDTGGQRGLFSCPAAIPSSRWDTNLNNTLGSAGDVYGVTSTTRFSYGINDWGLSINNNPQLGLGGDVDGGFYHGPVRDSDVVAPSQMIMLADTPAPANAALINFGADLDPTDQSVGHIRWPSNRHQFQADIVFTDGHTETPARPSLVDPSNTTWRRRWNNDNLSHNETTWSYNATAAAQLDSSY